MVSVKNFHRSARARPPPADTPDESSAVTTSQVTPSIHDFAVSLAKECGLATNYHNITHPRLPNYIAATSGLSYSALRNFLPDCSPKAGCNTPANSIFGQGES